MSTCACSITKAHFAKLKNKLFILCEKAIFSWNTCKLTFCHYKDKFNYPPNGSTSSHSQSIIHVYIHTYTHTLLFVISLFSLYLSLSLRVNHSKNAIVKPQGKAPDVAQREVDEAMRKVRQASHSITNVIEPGEGE